MEYTTPHHTTLHHTTLHYTHYTTLHLQLQLHYFTIHYTATTTTVHYTALHYTTLIRPHHNCNCNYTTLITLHYYNSTTLHYNLQLQLHYTTPHPEVVVKWSVQPLQPLQKTQLQPPFGPSVDSLCHPWFTTTNLSYRFPIFETSATALCGTTGTFVYGKSWICSPPIQIFKGNIHRKHWLFHMENLNQL